MKKLITALLITSFMLTACVDEGGDVSLPTKANRSSSSYEDGYDDIKGEAHGEASVEKTTEAAENDDEDKDEEETSEKTTEAEDPTEAPDEDDENDENEYESSEELLAANGIKFPEYDFELDDEEYDVDYKKIAPEGFDPDEKSVSKTYMNGELDHVFVMYKEEATNTIISGSIYLKKDIEPSLSLGSEVIDKNGKRKSSTESSLGKDGKKRTANTEFEYDENDRVIRQTETFENGSSVTTYKYDDKGSLTKCEYTYKVEGQDEVRLIETRENDYDDKETLTGYRLSTTDGINEPSFAYVTLDEDGSPVKYEYENSADPASSNCEEITRIKDKQKRFVYELDVRGNGETVYNRRESIRIYDNEDNLAGKEYVSTEFEGTKTELFTFTETKKLK